MPKSSPAEEITPHEDHPAFVDGRTAEAKAAFHLRLRARGIRDHAVLRAFEIVPRGLFLPGFAALAMREMPLPLPCGQTSHEPWRIAVAIEALAVGPTHRVIEIGSGSGYATAILAQLAGAVLGVERWADLAESAQARLRGLGLSHAAVAWADGLAVPPDVGRFDRILVHAGLPDLALLDGLMAPDARMVAGHRGRLVLRTAGTTRDLGVCCHAMLDHGLAGRPSRR